MLDKILDVGTYYDVWEQLKGFTKKLTKDLKFTKIDLKEGNEMVRTSWFGRHDYVPYVRIDLWKVGYRISYDPNYCGRYFFEYQPYLTVDQEEVIRKYYEDRLVNDEVTPKVTITRGGAVVREPAMLWRDVCRLVEQSGWKR